MQNLAKIGNELRMISFDNALIETKNRNLHFSKIRFLFSALSSAEWKVTVAEFLLYVEFRVSRLKNAVTMPKDGQQSESAHLSNRIDTFGLCEEHADIKVTAISSSM